MRKGICGSKLHGAKSDWGCRAERLSLLVGNHVSVTASSAGCGRPRANRFMAGGECSSRKQKRGENRMQQHYGSQGTKVTLRDSRLPSCELSTKLYGDSSLNLSWSMSANACSRHVTLMIAISTSAAYAGIAFVEIPL